MSAPELIKARCDNCGITFYASFDRLDHTGFVHFTQNESGLIARDYNFCCYDCEKAFVVRLEKRHPDIKGNWVPADADQMKDYSEYYEDRICALCGSKSPLQLSHIVPRFIAKWLKDTSATGFLRAGNPSRRVQDTFKINLLCANCEELFSTWEKYFAEQIFYPFHEGSNELLYDETMMKFAISLAWRLLRVNVFEFFDNPQKKEHAEIALDVWKDYLLGKRTDPGPYEIHAFFLDKLDTLTTELPDSFLWYTLRSIDVIVKSADPSQIFTYAKLPGILLVSSIYPTEFKGWNMSKVEKEGKFALPQEITNPDTLQFLIDRARMTFPIPLSEDEQKRISATMKNRKEQVLKSKTLQTLLAEGKRRRNSVKDKMNKAVRQLLEIMESAKVEKETSSETQAFADLGLHLIADMLVQLPDEKAAHLERNTKGAILRAKYTDSDASDTSDLGEVVVILHVCPHSSKEQRIKIIEDNFTKIENENSFPKAAALLILAWNPIDLPPSFELSYEIR
jgi:hypothetical protein